MGYLTRALTLASTTVEAQSLSREIQDELDMCRLQLGVARAYLAVSSDDDESKLILERSLVGCCRLGKTLQCSVQIRPSRLYNDFAARAELWEEVQFVFFYSRITDN